MISTPTALLAGAACFNCLTPKQQITVYTYLLAQISNAVANTSMDPKVLAKAAMTPPNAFQALSAVELEAIQVYLLTQIATAVGA